MNNCPFKINDRIFEKQTGNLATVTKITERGFEYKYDEPYYWHVLQDPWIGGECFCDLDYEQSSFELYNGNNEIKRPKFSIISQQNK